MLMLNSVAKSRKFSNFTARVHYCNALILYLSVCVPLEMTENRKTLLHATYHNWIRNVVKMMLQVLPMQLITKFNVFLRLITGRNNDI